MYLIEISERKQVNESSLRTPISATIECKDMQELESSIEWLPQIINASDSYEEFCDKIEKSNEQDAQLSSEK